MLGEQCPRCLSSAFEPVKTLLPEDVPRCGFCADGHVAKYTFAPKPRLDSPLAGLSLVRVRFDRETRDAT